MPWLSRRTFTRLPLSSFFCTLHQQLRNVSLYASLKALTRSVLEATPEGDCMF